MLYDRRWDRKQTEVERPETAAARQALLAAADYIEAHGWCQRFENWRGNVCAVEALNRIAGRMTPIGRAARGLFYERHKRHLLDFNDTPGRTKQEIVAALRAASLAN